MSKHHSMMTMLDAHLGEFAVFHYSDPDSYKAMPVRWWVGAIQETASTGQAWPAVEAWHGAMGASAAS